MLTRSHTCYSVHQQSWLSSVCCGIPILSKWVGLDNKNSQHQQSMGLYSGGFIIGRIFASEIWGALFREGLFFFFGGGGGGGGLISEFSVCF